ncbi:NIPSNAP family protein [Burkholderia sp. BCCIQ04A]|uniref:NIPSNAP family protein n=1 Tax=Burkholderia anthinoferrum TaxID=3090833 RepID=A0ABU5WIQ1_9BURK|nr:MULTISPECIES: NIPSNAP family protein [Burkholderia]MEB2503957.1 NIPSNAP family protein [Burkholderia anthinoferrum]MEB2530729.1 NIPSNAP family protein [Burkholderia anthinoferrum]MEB2560053.1 NIPSNAP family protein [Burkholderia anthinoferrum]MEB2578292.1 NIPSNAP family protein [Burkholderia anthinoferrum]KVH10841.1 NIPSNAP family containing protein [Burkholderia anthina]
MLYELTTLSCPLLDQDTVSHRAHRWVSNADAQGRLLGAWRTEIGELSRIVVLRGFGTRDELQHERDRALHAERPFGIESASVRLDMESYALFPFLPDIEPGALGGFYEIRRYWLKAGGIAPTLSAWERAVGPAKAYTSHLVCNMYALDGPPRITHIWGFPSLEARMALRKQHYAAGLWPPAGGPEQIERATSTIGLPEAWSPLR